jgi:hypothetical protein
MAIRRIIHGRHPARKASCSALFHSQWFVPRAVGQGALPVLGSPPNPTLNLNPNPNPNLILLQRAEKQDYDSDYERQLNKVKSTPLARARRSKLASRANRGLNGNMAVAENQPQKTA